MIVFEVWGVFHIDDDTLAHLFTTEEVALACQQECDAGKYFYLEKYKVYDSVRAERVDAP